MCYRESSSNAGLVKLKARSFIHPLLPIPVINAQRQQLFEMAGAGQTPYLIDPNTGAKGYESSEIVDYLEDTYAL